jgi:hypothetical protein
MQSLLESVLFLPSVVPGIDVDRHVDVPRRLDEWIRRSGPLIAYSARTLLEARRP